MYCVKCLETAFSVIFWQPYIYLTGCCYVCMSLQTAFCFQPEELVDKIKKFKRLESEVESKKRQVSIMRLDVSNLEAVGQLKGTLPISCNLFCPTLIMLMVTRLFCVHYSGLLF